MTILYMSEIYSKMYIIIHYTTIYIYCIYIVSYITNIQDMNKVKYYFFQGFTFLIIFKYIIHYLSTYTYIYICITMKIFVI